MLFAAAVAPASKSWIPVDSPQLKGVTDALSIAFSPDGKTGFMGVGINGVGSQIWKTVDSGTSFTPVWPTNDTKVAFDLFLGSAAKSPKEAIVTGALFQTYTTDGTNFQSSKNDLLAPSQDAGVLPDGAFGIIFGGSPNKNGVGVSLDGELYKDHNLGANVNASIFAARYGSFPTEKTWYVNTGCFPTNNNAIEEHAVNMRYTVNKRTGKQTIRSDVNLQGNPPVPCSQDITNCFAGGIFKTTDAGKSFQKVWSDETHNIYNNGINCFDENTCISVFEGETCGILLTTDGGKSWKQTMNDTDPHCSLTYVHMVSDQEIWVAGGLLESLHLEGRFWHSVDGGNTWTLETIRSFYVFDLDAVTNGIYAIGLDLAAGSGVELLYYTAPKTLSDRPTQEIV